MPEYPTDRVERELRARLSAGEWQPGERIPSVGTLAEEHETSRATVSKAVQRLVDQGLLVVLPNYGTFRAELPGESFCRNRNPLTCNSYP